MPCQNNVLIGLIAAIVFCSGGCGSNADAIGDPPSAPPFVVRPDSARNNQTILFLEARIRSDPDDFVAHKKLAAEYLRQMRETGDITYLDLALRAARTSLAIVPAEQNKSGLAALIQAEFASHDFAGARDHAKRLTEIDPDMGYVYQLLGDALLELGQYDDAKAAFREMEELGGLQAITRVAIEQRLSRMAALYGDNEKAKTIMRKALRIAETPPGTTAETIAFCQWQLGELDFATGKYDSAQKYFEASLNTLPGHYRAMASLGRIHFAKGDVDAAIDSFEKVTAKMPDPSYVAYLGDLLAKAGRGEEAARQYALVEQIAKLGEAKGGLYDRELANFYANHDMNPNETCDAAAKVYQVRRDIYGADVYSWACLKAGRLEEARVAMSDALRLGTRDARLFYHAGMVEKALGNKETARKHLNAAIKLNPAFDVLQSDTARNSLRELK